MTLYKADFLDLVSKPVKKTTHKVLPKVKEEKEPVEDIPTPVVKPKTEKQIAAIERRKLAAKEKKEKEMVLSQEIIKKQNEVEEKEQELLQKKNLQKEKRRQKRSLKVETQEATPSTTSVEIDEAIAEAVKPPPLKKQKTKSVQINNPAEPPAWFQKYVEGVNKEQNLLSRENKKPVKQIKLESQQEAAKSWNDDLTRDRVKQEVDGHMGRMYNMMFGVRKLL